MTPIGFLRRAQNLALPAALAAAGLAGCATHYAEPSISAAIDPYGLAPPEKSRPWQPTAGQAATAPNLASAARLAPGNALVESAKTYRLADLVDLALRANPATRSSWEEARAAAAGLGIAEAAWLPVIGVSIPGGYGAYPHAASGGAFQLEGVAIYPTLSLSWTLFDLARPERIEQALQQLYAANLSLNRTHQEVAYGVESAFFALLASRAKVGAAEVTLRQATANTESVQAQLDRGLATRPDLLLAVQEQAKAGYQLQEARGEVMDGEAKLAASLGTTPNNRLRTVELAEIPLPAAIEGSADEIIDRALTQRPDLAAKLAELRARDAEIRKAEAGYWPTVAVNAHGGWKQWHYTQHGGTGSGAVVDVGGPLADAYLTLDWNLFEGFATRNAVNQATAQRNAAQADFDALQLQVIQNVWKSYADVKTAVRKREFALAMVEAGKQSYQATFESYWLGLSTAVQLLAAERDLANARYTEIDSKAALLQAAASLIYAAGAGLSMAAQGSAP